MRVVLTTQISGSRDGQNWPGPGTTVDLPDAEARALIAGGSAKDPDDEGRTVVVSPAGVHTPGTTGWPESMPLVTAPADAATNLDQAAKAAQDAREGNYAVEVPVGTGTASPTGAAMTQEGVEKSAKVEQQNREDLAAGTLPTVGEKARGKAGTTGAATGATAKKGGDSK